MSTTSYRIAGTWEIVSADAEVDGEHGQPYGAQPVGLLTFTEDCHVTVVINRRDIPPLASGDRTVGTADEYRVVVRGSLGLYGTHRTDERGDFLDQRVIGSTFPNWDGLRRGREQRGGRLGLENRIVR